MNDEHDTLWRAIAMLTVALLLPLTLDAGTYTHGGESIPALTATASTKDGRVLLTLANMDPNRGRTVAASLPGQRFSRVSGRILTAETMTAHNTFDHPDAVAPAPFDGARIDREQLTIELPPMAIVALDLE